jgi:hypothetical protein
VNSNRPIIGNGHDMQVRSFSTPPSGVDPFFDGAYPGLGQGAFSEFPQAGGGLPVPFQGGGSILGTGQAGSSNPLRGINFNQIKGYVDRMGGIDGIIGTMTKVQKFMGTFRQMAPMLKVLFNSFGKGRVKAANRKLRRPGQRHRRRQTPIGSKPFPINKRIGTRRGTRR